MSEYTKQTLEYYDAHASEFLLDTGYVDFSDLQNLFIDELEDGASILDVGCGSGRDIVAFSQAGLKVDAFDGSSELCKLASKLSGQPVSRALFDEYEPDGLYQGIWACSAFLHVSREELPDLLEKYGRHLERDGVMYLSFKYGNFEGMRNGRFFLDLTEESFGQIIGNVTGLKVKRYWYTYDVRTGRDDEKWLNICCAQE